MILVSDFCSNVMVCGCVYSYSKVFVHQLGRRRVQARVPPSFRPCWIWGYARSDGCVLSLFLLISTSIFRLKRLRTSPATLWAPNWAASTWRSRTCDSCRSGRRPLSRRPRSCSLPGRRLRKALLMPPKWQRLKQPSKLFVKYRY